MKVVSTNNYGQFKLRNDNRKNGIIEKHVLALMESIKKKNRLYLFPIKVNRDWEVMDGQHRLEAAKRLGVEIFYVQDATLEAADIIDMNRGKQWLIGDYLNFYVKNGFVEYQKLEKFLLEKDLTLRVALRIFCGGSREAQTKFKDGEFVMPEVEDLEIFDLCRQSLDYIVAHTIHKATYKTGKVYKALITLMRHSNFDIAIWNKNVERLIPKFAPRVTETEYLKLFLEIYNHNNRNKIRFEDLDDTVSE